MDDNRILVDTIEAAELLSISPRQVYVLAAKGRLQKVKIGSSTRYRVVDLIQFAEDNLKGVI